MSDDRIVYEGDVVLRCQEGGFAHPAIECVGEPGGRPQDVAGKLSAFFHGGESAKTLDEMLVETFGLGERDSIGDDHIARLRITVERIEGP